MSDRVSIRVKADFPHSTARVGGMTFSKLQALTYVKDALSEEVLQSEILDVQPYEEPKAQKVSEKHAEKPADATAEPESEVGEAGVKPNTPKGG